MAKKPLLVKQILAWADAYHARTGFWPRSTDGRIPEGRGLSWSSINGALWAGVRGLRSGSSLARLLAKRRRVHPNTRRRQLTEEMILAWADAFHARTGAWPKPASGKIPGTARLRWSTVARALHVGLYGLRGSSSLARFLAEHRGVPRWGRRRPSLTEEQILKWADAHAARHGRWPTRHSGRIAGAAGESWRSVDYALQQGRRGFPGGSDLARLLAARRPGHCRGRLTEEQIVAWAEDHHARTGQWPRASSGVIEGVPGLNWSKINTALEGGRRGLSGNSSLAKLLLRRRGVHSPGHAPPLTIEQILAWADLHQQRHGDWPKFSSGPIDDAPEETWLRMDKALTYGRRGLAGGTTLAGLLAEKRHVFVRKHGRPLRVKQILAWADAHHQRTGRWPTFDSGPVIDAPWPETWGAINGALHYGHRGLETHISLPRLLAEHRNVPYHRRSRETLTLEQVLGWARAHRSRTGKWPVSNSGLIAESSGDTWHAVDSALRKGSRGLPGGLSLYQFLRHHGKKGRAL